MRIFATLKNRPARPARTKLAPILTMLGIIIGRRGRHRHGRHPATAPSPGRGRIAAMGQKSSSFSPATCGAAAFPAARAARAP